MSWAFFRRLTPVPSRCAPVMGSWSLSRPGAPSPGRSCHRRQPATAARDQRLAETGRRSRPDRHQLCAQCHPRPAAQLASSRSVVGSRRKGTPSRRYGRNLVASPAACAAHKWHDLCTPDCAASRSSLGDELADCLSISGFDLPCSAKPRNSAAPSAITGPAAATHCAGLRLHLGSVAMTALAITVSDLGTSRASWRLRSGPPTTRRSNVLR